MSGQVEEAERIAQSFQTEAIGKIKLTAPDELCERYIVPAMAEFLADQPGLAIEIELSSRRVDIVGEGFDLAIRASLRRRADLDRAAPGYLAGHVDRLARLSRPPWHAGDAGRASGHDIVHHSGLKAGALWVMRRGGEERRIPVSAHVQVNIGGVLRDSAIAGLGITYLPEFITGDAIRSGKLVRVLTDWRIQSVDINAVYPSNRNITPKVRGFVSVLARRSHGAPDFMEQV